MVDTKLSKLELVADFPLSIADKAKLLRHGTQKDITTLDQAINALRALERQDYEFRKVVYFGQDGHPDRLQIAEWLGNASQVLQLRKLTG